MIITATATLQDKTVTEYLGIVMGNGGGMLMVSASGTAIRIR